MKALIVYDSFFGNTERIAKAIANSIKSRYEVNVIHISQFNIESLKGIDLLIVGSPTRVFEPTKNIARTLRKLNSKEFSGLTTAVFDTRMDIEKTDIKILKFLEKRRGYALDTMIKILRKRGFNIHHKPEGFIVENSEGPLRPGELEKAEVWASKLV